MGIYKYLRKLWRKPKKSKLWRKRLQKLRKEPSIKRIEKPTRLDRARSLGWKAKQGFVAARIKIKRGGRKRPKPSGGRRSKRSGIKGYKPAKSLQRIAEERVGKKFPNLEVLNSYWLAEDGKHKWFEVLLIDPHSPAVMADKQASKIAKQRGRAARGLTSAGKKARGK